MRIRNAVTALAFLIGVGVLAGHVASRPDAEQAGTNCPARLTEHQIRRIVSREIQKRRALPDGMDALQLEDEQFGDLEIKLNDRDPDDHTRSEYSDSKYLIQFSKDEFEFWALLSPCGQVNMAGVGKFSK